jgi:hypothetical protein
MADRIALEGMRFGRLLVQNPVREVGMSIRYSCRCDCGKTKIIYGQHLRRGLTQSCGCLQRERSSAASFQHGKSKTSIHNIWLSMLQRCEDSNHQAFKDYGARGITVCLEWHDFATFYRDMGDPPKGLTLERKDNDLGYSKKNCLWATRRRQANNRRSNVFLTFRGRTQTQAEWAREVGITQKKLWQRLNRGWSVERALSP